MNIQNIDSDFKNFDKKLEFRHSISKEDIENIFDTKFGARIKGITLRNDSYGNKYIILFRNCDGPYPDFGTKDKFTYLGEGLNGDQKLTIANNALKKSISGKMLIYGFWHDGSKDFNKLCRYEYIGHLKVESCKWDYDPESRRKVYLFGITKST